MSINASCIGPQSLQVEPTYGALRSGRRSFDYAALLGRLHDWELSAQL